MIKLYEVDPEADTLLIVPHPSRPFAPWDATSSDTTTTTTTTGASSPSDVYAGILRGTSRPPNIYASIASAPELRVKVSSQHLALASKHFRNRFRYPPPQQQQHQPNDNGDASDGRIHITLAPGYDPQAIITVMDIVHGRGRKVPRTLPDVEALAKIAVVVDAFKFHDAVDVYAERWFAGLWRGQRPDETPAVDDRELVLWIYASYVFRQTEVFKEVTKIAVLRSEGPIPSLGLHVREGVIREIESRRQQALSTVLEQVHTALDALQQDENPCALGCDTFLLGALVKSLRRAKLAVPSPAQKKPSQGVRVVNVSRAVHEAQDVLTRQFLVGSSFGSAAWGLGIGAGGRKRKTPNAQPVVSRDALLTPESSPEPERASSGFRDVHTCQARRGDLLERLEELERGVEGLDLESKLGYYLY